ncbi:MAG: response regulator [Bacteriovorax sp.]|nr:response regulator [Bacteriovorax sp.]
MNILVVDDSRAIYAMVSQMLQEGGHTSVWAEDGLKAVDILTKNNTIEIILLDWNMPNMNGLEFLEKNAKENFTKAPIIMMTTENSPEFIKKALSLNAAEYIMKPFTKDILFNKFTLVELML